MRKSKYLRKDIVLPAVYTFCLLSHPVNLLTNPEIYLVTPKWGPRPQVGNQHSDSLRFICGGLKNYLRAVLSSVFIGPVPSAESSLLFLFFSMPSAWLDTTGGERKCVFFISLWWLEPLKRSNWEHFNSISTVIVIVTFVSLMLPNRIIAEPEAALAGNVLHHLFSNEVMWDLVAFKHRSSSTRTAAS